ALADAVGAAEEHRGGAGEDVGDGEEGLDGHRGHVIGSWVGVIQLYLRPNSFAWVVSSRQ
ncbi:MAG: hypothetical protein EBS90_12605, partial [Betaproteobacteria bacterium]|nr:hypothetical protein [Betaproteobacteria bacterium]